MKGSLKVVGRRVALLALGALLSVGLTSCGAFHKKKYRFGGCRMEMVQKVVEAVVKVERQGEL